MSYIKAVQILPEDLLRQVQDYVDGAYIYIPRVAQNRGSWGSNTTLRDELARRDAAIYREHQSGCPTRALAKKYFLSEKSIQRILRSQRQQKQVEE